MAKGKDTSAQAIRIQVEWTSQELTEVAAACEEKGLLTAARQLRRHLGIPAEEMVLGVLERAHDNGPDQLPALTVQLLDGLKNCGWTPPGNGGGA